MRKEPIFIEVLSPCLHRGEHQVKGTVLQVEKDSNEHADLLTSGRCRRSNAEAFQAWQKKSKSTAERVGT